jgi:hypothetical protein
VAKRNSYNLIVFFILFFIFENVAFSAVYRGVGAAVIEGKDLKTAEISAKKNAIDDAIGNYLKSKYSGDRAIPEVTSEYFKFLKSFKIISRNIENYRVIYTVDADVIDFDIDDVYRMVNRLVTSAVYVFNLNGDLSDLDKNKIDYLVDNKLKLYNIDTQYEKDFMFSIENVEDTDKIITAFANSPAQYLFVIDVDSNITKIDNKAYCRVEIMTNIYSRENKNKPIKTISTSIADSSENALTDAINKSLDKMLNYVISNVIKLNKTDNVIANISITFMDFKRVGDVYEMLKFMQDRGFINNYNIEKFDRNKLVAKVNTVYKVEGLVDKISKYKMGKDFNVGIESGKIMLRFNLP